MYAALMDRLGNPPDFPRHTSPIPVEAGRVSYQAGNRYRFGLVLGTDARPDLATWRRRLASGPRTPGGRAPGAPLGDNFVIERVWDAVAAGPMRRGATPRSWLPSDLASVAAPLADATTVRLRFHTPLLVAWRDRGRRRMIDDRNADPARFFQRLATGIHKWFPDLSLPQLPSKVDVLENGLVRADVRYPKKSLYGATGTLTLAFPGRVGLWALPLVLGGVVGVGHATNMGQGHYEVLEAPVPNWPPQPARTLLQRAGDPDVLDEATDALRGAGRTPGVDGISLDDFLDRAEYEQGRITAAFEHGAHAVDALRGLLLRREDGRYRPIAVPTFRDRLAQRAVLVTLRPTTEQRLDDSSHAYRRGLSRRTAQRSVQRAYDDGFRWVLDADIASFFDEVEWPILERKLTGLFGLDPVVPLLMDWTRAPVVFDGRTISRRRGLPQGSVVSPLLANLYLDAFDRAMRERGLRMVRYADDFLVLCRSQNEVHAARDAVDEELAHLDLELREEKTEGRSFDQGFEFLGSVFCRSLVLDRARPAPGGGPVVIEDLRTVRSDLGALAQLRESAGWIGRIDASGPEPRHARRWRSPSPDSEARKRPVYVVHPDADVRSRSGNLEVRRPDSPPARIPWRNISRICLQGAYRVRPSVYAHALRHGVPIAIHRRDGKLAGRVLPADRPLVTARVEAQWDWIRQPEAVLGVARGLVEAKIHNTRLVLRRHGIPTDHDAPRRMAMLARDALNAESLDRLRGIEGMAAHVYFAVWPDLVTQHFPWPGRTGRRASDPLNATLNFVYSLLYGRTWLSLVGAGLDPHGGMLHAPSRRYAALASDVMEPFRFLADRVVLDGVRRRWLNPDHFHRSEKAELPCRLRPDGLRRVVHHWEAALAREVQWDGKRGSYERHLREQCTLLGDTIDGKRALAPAFRMKW